jgi:methylated-DNA-[protein]-cysteine S-methyltransferase
MNIYYTTIETPVGWLLLVGKSGSLIRVEMPRPTKEAASALAPAEAVEQPDEFGDIAERLRLYFSGEPVDFSDAPVCFDGLGEFEKLVLQETMKVPHGKLTTYATLAAASGSPRALR